MHLLSRVSTDRKQPLPKVKCKKCKSLGFGWVLAELRRQKLHLLTEARAVYPYTLVFPCSCDRGLEINRRDFKYSNRMLQRGWAMMQQGQDGLYPIELESATLYDEYKPKKEEDDTSDLQGGDDGNQDLPVRTIQSGIVQLGDTLVREDKGRGFSQKDMRHGEPLDPQQP